MATETAARRRAHVVLPQGLVDEIDARVGARGRSRFIQEAVEERLQRERRGEALEGWIGSLSTLDVPEWETTESTYRWVRRMRGDCDSDAANDDTSR